MNYWLHRISYQAELSYPLLHKGFLTIGFSDFTTQEFIDEVRNNNWEYFKESFESEWGKLPRSRWTLWNFLHFNKGDIIIVPSWGTFFICEVIGDKPIIIGESVSEDLKNWAGEKIVQKGNLLYSESNQKYDLGFAIQIKILHKDISRDKFADAKLTSRMKIRQTNANIDDLKSSIENCIANFKVNKPIHLHSLIVDNTSTLVLDTIKNNLNPDKFERLVRVYFESIGADEVYIPAKNETDKEGDADIVAVFEKIKLIIYIQAKFQKGKINEWGATQVEDYKSNQDNFDDGYNKIAWVITTANDFDEKAKVFAKENEIQLINGIEFAKMILNSGIYILDKKL